MKKIKINLGEDNCEYQKKYPHGCGHGYDPGSGGTGKRSKYPFHPTGGRAAPAADTAASTATAKSER
ncbi:hypothetical protein [Collimonas sp. OK242]|jgi:hypothetical protein|uniref:hypothetical protein n=1 Tax=Collimonas sp. OK242 TaxID=1798195 RepID=UPI00115FFFF1|nr:hypothetical protein [Collimonas sp. OK242]